MNKIKKIINISSPLLFLSIPIASIVSCSSSSDDKTKIFKWDNKLDENWEAVNGLERIATPVTNIKKFLLAEQRKGKYTYLTKQTVESISIADVRNFNSAGTAAEQIDANKLQALKEIDALLVDFAFKNNNNKEKLKEIVNFIKESGLPIYSINSIERSKGKSPIRVGANFGIKSYYRRDLGFELRTTRDGDYWLLNFDPTKKTPSTYDNKLVEYTTLTKKNLNETRLLDHSFSNVSLFSGVHCNTTFSIITNHQKYGTLDKVESVDANGKNIWSKEKTFINKLFPGIKIKIGGNEYTNVEDVNFIKKLEDSRNHQLKFITSNNVKYAKINSAGQIQESDVVFKAKDLYYGFMRQLYSVQKFREEGILNGVSMGTTIVSEGALKKLETELKTNLPDLQNAYLWDLYGVDVKQTLLDNEKNMSNIDNEFILSFKKGQAIGKTTLQLFTNATTITTIPSEIIDKRTSAWQVNNINKSDPAVKYGLLTYGKNKMSNGALDLPNMDTYSIAPYLYTSYDTRDGKKVTMQLNKFYGDSIVRNNSRKFIEIYEQIMKSSSIDEGAFAILRKRQYEQGKSHEYILNESVQKTSSLIKEIQSKSNLTILQKPNTNQGMNWAFSYALWGYKDNNAYNDLAKKIVYGYKTNEEIETNNDAIDNFLDGDGALLRATMKAAINWHSVIQGYLPNQDKTFYGQLGMEGMLEFSGFSEEEGRSSFLSTTEEYTNIYNLNTNYKVAQFISPKFKQAKKTLNALANKVGATKDKPAKFQLFNHIFMDKKAQDSHIFTNDLIIFILNKLTDGKIVFSWKNTSKSSWSDFSDKSRTKNTSFINSTNYGPDYYGVGSHYQQYLCSYGTTTGISLIREALK